jgi:tetratricopeptide (TPR) repeat protein
LAHLNPAAVRLCLETLPRREREVVAHLLSCAAFRKAVAPDRRDPCQLPGPGRSHESFSYDQVFARALSRVQEQWAVAEDERQQAGQRFDELWSLPRSRWREAFVDPCPVAFLTLVLDRAFECAATDPRTCRGLALLTRSAARRRRDLLGALRDELIGRTWTVEGYCHALRREWQPADAALARASQLLASCPNPMAEAELCRVLAESHLGRGSSGEALALLARAARLAGEIGDVEREVCDLGRQAGILTDRADLEAAAGLLAAALLRAEDAGLASAADQVRLRLLWTLQALGRYGEAREVAPSAAAAAAARSDDLMLVAAGHVWKGQTDSAEELLVRAGEMALAQGDAAVAAAAALQLAQIYLLGSRSPALRGLAPRFEWLAAAPSLPPRPRAALHALAVALRDEVGSLQPLVLAAAAALDRSRD